MLSVVIPCHNEEGNLSPLVEGIVSVLNGQDYEIWVADDGSTDQSWKILRELAQRFPQLHAIRLSRKRGQSVAFYAAFRASRGETILTMDADLQNDPRDIPVLLNALDGVDCVCGSRVESRSEGDSYYKVLSSQIANSIRKRVLGDSLSDAACGFRVFRRDCFEKIYFFRGGHRFLPILIRMSGGTVKEVPVQTNPRFSGMSHYGVWNRLFETLLDLLMVRWMRSRGVSYDTKETLGGEEAKGIF